MIITFFFLLSFCYFCYYFFFLVFCFGSGVFNRCAYFAAYQWGGTEEDREERVIFRQLENDLLLKYVFHRTLALANIFNNSWKLKKNEEQNELWKHKKKNLFILKSINKFSNFILLPNLFEVEKWSEIFFPSISLVSQFNTRKLLFSTHLNSTFSFQ